ncbi:TonB-dependent siderophore receptor [Caenimonas sedimenti]|uniref:TonB-dependent siderophore receptor n=1 Tax=Caenimonas sedimenti TaxID=2596921 RepID=A0A562ZTG4_9BURK|nr:TonB-dependent siderophore receptor [Caenimonas sedimenti]TWO71900.1 TonB-dependent siderophore receptor [Caenimonas sedimenti]
MAIHQPIPRAVALLLAALAASTAHAQTGTLRPITVTGGNSAPAADVIGFGDVPLQEVPASASVITRRQIEDVGARRLADLIQFDSSISDAYNSPGYWDQLTIRGFTLDNRFNYRREGLPISAETMIGLENKERIEVLKGTSGIQAGTSAPGGLVNYVVKRPTRQDLREVRLQATQKASLLGAVDLGGRFGTDGAAGYRLNAAHERLRPQLRNLDGERSLLALATDWRIGRDSVLETEFEWSRQSQPSQAGFSLLGASLPAVPDPRLNLNNQPWSQPNVMEGLTGTVRFEQALNAQWRWTAQLGSQHLKTDDRLAFSFGCGAEGNFDRFCSDGTYDLYDFRSEGERRRQDAGSLQLKGKVTTGSVSHDLSFGAMATRLRNRFQMQAFNYVGSGNVQGTAVLPADPRLTDQSTNRDERSVEFSVQDAIHWNDRFSTWVGVRHTRLDRESVRTDGSRPTAYDQGVTTPWLAASYKLAPATMAYASWGQGVESQVVPNRTSQYSNAGIALPALKSKQWELGVKGGTDPWAWQLAWFQIERPVSNLDACSRLGITPCEGRNDGNAVHRGLEASAQWLSGPVRLAGSATWLDAERRGSTAEPAVNGQKPTNVPDLVLRAHASWKVPSVTGLELQGHVSHESRRNVVPDGSITLPSWTRVDAALRYDHQIGATRASWTLGIDNVFDRRHWRESPYQFGHVYLYQGAPRTLRLAFTAAL